MDNKKFYPLTEEIVTETEETSYRAMAYMAQHLEEVKNMSREERQALMSRLYRGEVNEFTDTDSI
jgi:hypothetical protein